jgi:hypothetical protein
MVLPFLLPHRPPPCGGIALQIRLGKFHCRMFLNFSDMNVVFHICKLSIYNLPVSDPIEVSRLCGLEAHTF